MHPLLTTSDDPGRFLDGLSSGLVDGSWEEGHFAQISADELPEACRELLVHPDHMTTRLGKYYGQPVSLKVLHEHADNGAYRREILLSTADGSRIVEYGVVRIVMRFVPEPARSAILAKEAPLGEILIRNDVLRRIEPRWFFRIAQECPLVGHFGESVRDVYGRVGTIYCDEQPAIELLEVVTGARD